MSWIIPGVEVRCPLCLALDELEELRKIEDLGNAISEAIPDAVKTLKELLLMLEGVQQ
jgi:hypothetical protein